MQKQKYELTKKISWRHFVLRAMLREKVDVATEKAKEATEKAKHAAAEAREKVEEKLHRKKTAE